MVSGFIWLIPVVIAAVLVAPMSAIYIGSVIDPTGHLHDLPVFVVNQDQRATADGKKVDVGADLVNVLEQSGAVGTDLKPLATRSAASRPRHGRAARRSHLAEDHDLSTAP